MRSKDLIKYGEQALQDKVVPIQLMEQLFDCTKAEILLNQEQTEEDTKRYQDCIEQLKSGYPFQYLIGTVNFYGYEYQVTEAVLIPRFETEQLVEKVIHYQKQYFQQPTTLLDLGTGSGAIGLTIKQEVPETTVVVSDISEDALAVAKQNGQGIDIEYVQGNLLDPLIGRNFDVIVSNPPYVKTIEPVMKSVEQYEPHLALYAGIDGLDCYREIIKNAPACVNDKFLMAFEIGETQGKDIKDLAYQTFPDAKIWIEQDMQEKDRFLFIFKNSD